MAKKPRENGGNRAEKSGRLPATGHEKLWSLIENRFLMMDKRSLQKSFADHLEFSLAKNRYTANRFDLYKSIVYSVRDRLAERWDHTQRTYYAARAKRVYYLSLEFLQGRALGNALLNMGLGGEAREALRELGYALEELQELEPDAGLGNGGLGRLASCFLDSLATHQYPADGYGIRYEYGIFEQNIEDGRQVERPDNWLRYGNPWEMIRAEFRLRVGFYGHVETSPADDGRVRFRWVPGERVVALPFDMPIPGYGNDTVNTLRLWSARAETDFDLDCFNEGDYVRAVWDKVLDENITKVLYPKDDVSPGRELRLKQEYFFVAASIHDIIRRFQVMNRDFAAFPDQVAIQLNDTHPALAIPELMRILLDREGLGWDDAWRICRGTFGYTNHTVMSEALEKWPVEMLARLLPRHLQIIYEINRRFLEEVRAARPGDEELIRRVSLIDETPVKSVRMAHLAIAGSHAVNGVAAIHTGILTDRLFRDFYQLDPARFSNKTNGVTQRRWLRLCNPRLSDLITSRIGDGWVTDLSRLRRLEEYASGPEFQRLWRQVKRACREDLAAYIRLKNGIEVSPDSLFDCQVKRIHEYKRQLLNVLHVITFYNRIRRDPLADAVPRTVIFSGKAAPGYWMAKLVIRLIHAVAETVNRDPAIDGRLKVVFLANYGVSLAERIIPAADLSEQISTAGMEASGTGNMKLALNGAVTIGTLDGANVEICEEVGDDNIFIFGLTAAEVAAQQATGYDPAAVAAADPELREALEMIAGGFFRPSERDLFQPVVDALRHADPYLLLADYASYVACQERVSRAFRDEEAWTRMSILNCARSGKFSSDRTVQEYARDIWNARPVAVRLGEKIPETKP